MEPSWINKVIHVAGHKDLRQDLLLVFFFSIVFEFFCFLLYIIASKLYNNNE